MKQKLIICGGNGAGKSTLGRALADKTGWVFRDIEDYYFPKTNPDFPYAVQRTEAEIADMLYVDLQQDAPFILAAVRGNYSEKVAAMFTSAVFIRVPKEIRMKRVRQRALDRFGDRVLEGGDLYESENAFYALIEKRNDQTILDWLNTLNIPVMELELDGTQPVLNNVEMVCSLINTPTEQQEESNE